MTPVPCRAGRWLVLLAALLAALGCGGRRLYPVRGKVTFPDGQPLSGGQVVFESVDDPTMSARGEIQSDGTFRMGTFKDSDGVLAGRHRVLVVPPLGPNPDKPVRVIDPRFQSFDTSGLEYTAPDEEFNITVERP